MQAFLRLDLSFEVRLATTADVTQYRSIRLEALELAPEAFGSTWREVSQRPLSNFEEYVQRGHVYLGFVDGVVVGTSSYAPYTFDRRRSAGLFGMYVNADLQGSGLADLLVANVKSAAVEDGHRELYLSVNQRIRRAVRFYLRQGFVDTGHREAMDRDPSIQLMTMKAPLEPQ